MLDTMTRWISAFGDLREREGLRKVVKPSIDRLSSQGIAA